MLLNQKTKKLLETMAFSGGRVYVFRGEKGIGRMCYMRQAAAAFFHIPEKFLADQPDYYELHSEKTIGVGDLSDFRSFTEYLPANAPCKVAVIDADGLTDEAQASLLKLLEDGATHVMFVLIVNRGLLDTIISRSRVIPFLPVENEKMESLGGDPVARALAFGRPGMFYVLSCPEQKAYIQTCERAADAILSRDRVGIMQALHLVKEKDKEAFFECYGKNYTLMFFKYLQERISMALASCSDANQCEKLKKLSMQLYVSHLCMVKAGSYSKNDFFEFVRSICDCC